MLLKNSYLAALCLVCALFSPLVLSQAFNVKDYDIYHDNRSGSNGDIYLHSPERFIPIGTDIIVPIILPSKGTVFFDKDENQLFTTQINQNTVNALTSIKENTHYFYEDINRDGLTDVRVYSRANDGSGIVFYGGDSAAAPVARAFDFTNAPQSARFASSSQLKPTHSGIKIFTASDSNVDVVTLMPPNASGVSVNSFAEFSTADRGVRILNTAGLYIDENGIERQKQAASTTIIIADTIELVNEIEIIGASSDIVILSPSESGEITCDGCVFKNTDRIALLTAVPSEKVDQNTSRIGQLRPGLQSRISVSNLYAPASISVEFATQNLEVTGTVDTHQRATQRADGGLVELAHGDKRIGSAQVNILLGQLEWIYETGQIKKALAHSDAFTLSGDYRSTSVNAVVNGHLTFEGFIDTTADVIATATYKNQVFVPQEGITLSTTGTNKNLIIRNEVVTHGALSYNATGNLTLNETVQDTQAKSISIITGRDIKNNASLKAQTISLSGLNVINEGSVSADIKLEAFAENNLMNQYGGRLSGAKMHLVAENGVVRNGSRTPYISKPYEIEGLFDYEGITSFSNEDVTKQGSFYEVFSSVLVNTSDLLRPQKNHAYITASELVISAPGVENINPYYVPVTKPGPLELTHSKLNQVVISAEKTLLIAQPESQKKPTDYIVNSSAYIVVSDRVNGKLQLEAGAIINERYRVATVIDLDDGLFNAYEEESYGEEFSVRNGDRVINSMVSMFSPPGRIVGMGNAYFEASQIFSNNMSYVEIFNDVKMISPVVESLGVESETIRKEYQGYLEDDEVGLNTLSVLIASERTVNINPQELDTLFYIRGNYDAQDSFFSMFSVVNLLDHYANLSVSHIVSRQMSENETTESWVSGGHTSAVSGIYSRKAHELYYYNASNSVEIDRESNRINIETDLAVQHTVSSLVRMGEYGEILDDSTTTTQRANKELKESKGLWETLLNYAQETSSSVEVLFNEFNWWGEEQ